MSLLSIKKPVEKQGIEQSVIHFISNTYKIEPFDKTHHSLRFNELFNKIINKLVETDLNETEISNMINFLAHPIGGIVWAPTSRMKT